MPVSYTHLFRGPLNCRQQVIFPIEFDLDALSRYSEGLGLFDRNEAIRAACLHSLEVIGQRVGQSIIDRLQPILMVVIKCQRLTRTESAGIEDALQRCL